MSDITEHEIEVLELNYLNKRSECLVAESSMREAYAQLLAARRQFLTHKLSGETKKAKGE